MLGADATTQYAVGTEANWWPKELTAMDLESTSPYNTRKLAGLPPRPICSPGLAAINAVLNYVDTPYVFYLTGKDGKTYFGKTIEEHNANIRNYLQ
jgi:UPF0755 protein